MLLQVYLLLLPTVALACSKAAFHVGRISLCGTCDGLMSRLQIFSTSNMKTAEHRGVCVVFTRYGL